MREPRQVTGTSTRAHILVGTATAIGAVATLLVGRLAFSVFVAVVLVAAFVDLRKILGEGGHAATLVAGAAGVCAFLWCGYEGDLDLIPAVAATLLITLLVIRIALNEAGSSTGDVTIDLAATLGAAGLVGILGSHVLLIRAVPRFGFRGIVAFVGMVIASEAASFVVGHLRGRRTLHRHLAPQKTWEGVLAGFIAPALVGMIVGVVLDPPFDLSSGALFGIAIGIVVPLADLGFAAIKRSAGVRHSGSYLGAAGGALDVINGVVFAAPVFYWAFRTIAL